MRLAASQKDNQRGFYLRQKLEGLPACVLHHAKPVDYSFWLFWGQATGCCGVCRRRRPWQDESAQRGNTTHQPPPNAKKRQKPMTSTPTMTAARSPWRQTLSAALLCACMAWGLMATPGDAHAARKKKDDASSSHTASPQKGAAKVKYFGSSSEESTAQRDRRLYRECKGRPDAGACLGYTRR